MMMKLTHDGLKVEPIFEPLNQKLTLDFKFGQKKVHAVTIFFLPHVLNLFLPIFEHKNLMDFFHNSPSLLNLQKGMICLGLDILSFTYKKTIGLSRFQYCGRII